MSDDDFDNESEGIKSVRKALEKKEQELKERDKLLADLLAKDRQRSIADKFTEFKINPKIAKMVPSDIEVDKLDEWIGENADWLGVNMSNDSDAHAAEAASQDRVSHMTSAPGEQDDPDLRAILECKDISELTNLIYARQAGVR